MTEQWKAVVGFEGRYEVSDLGRVRSLDMIVRGRSNSQVRRSGRVLKPQLQKQCGYLTVTLGQGRMRLVHRLVLEAFAGPCPGGSECCHDNGVRTDCRAENLRWDTRRANHADKNRHGTMPRGERNGNSRQARARQAELRS